MTLRIHAKTSHSIAIRSLLLCGAGSLLPLAPALAQAADAREAGDEIVVSGARPIAESEAAALQVQKLSDSLVSVAASDAVGRLPDQNIAQAAGRLPGIAIERDQGQARYFSLAEGSFGRAFAGGLFVAQDGQNAPAAQNFKLVAWSSIARALRRQARK